EVRGAIHPERDVAVHRARGSQLDEGLVVVARGVANHEIEWAGYRRHGVSPVTSHTTTRDCTPLRSPRISSAPSAAFSTSRAHAGGMSVQPTKLRKTTRAPGAAV